MKKIILIILLIIGGISLQAQDFHFGAKAGVNFNKWKFSEGDDSPFDGKTGFDIGLVAEYSLNEKMAIGSELVYVNKGDKGTEDGRTFTYATDYLEIPLLFKYYVAEGFSLEAGPQLGIFLSSKFTVEYEGEEASEDFDDVMKSTEFGFNIGAGYKLDNGLFFNIRYTPGLTDILDVDGGTEIKNSAFRFGVGYYFK